jgi:hypothetical protein
VARTLPNAAGAVSAGSCGYNRSPRETITIAGDHHHPRRDAGAGTELTLDGRVLDERGKCAPGEQLRDGPRQGPEQVRDHRGRQQEEEDRKSLLDRVDLFDPIGESLTAGCRDQDPDGSQHGEGREKYAVRNFASSRSPREPMAEKSTPRFSFAVAQPGVVLGPHQS